MQEQLNRRLYRVIVQVACSFVVRLSIFALSALGLLSAAPRDASAMCAALVKNKNETELPSCEYTVGWCAALVENKNATVLLSCEYAVGWCACYDK